MTHEPVEPQTRAMAAIGLGVSAASALAPVLFHRTFGLTEEPTGSSRLGWRLFAVRTATLSVLAAQGNRTARDAFLPVQVMDQAAWWWGRSRGELPLRTTLMASVASGAIIALDVHRRSEQRSARSQA